MGSPRYSDEFQQSKRSMSRRGNCYDNAAIESFFDSLKKERIQRKKYRTRGKARSDGSMTLKHSPTEDVATSILAEYLRLNLKRIVLQARGVTEVWEFQTSNFCSAIFWAAGHWMVHESVRIDG